MKLSVENVFECIPAIYYGNLQEDNKENLRLYRKLVKESENTGFCPVLIKKDHEFDYLERLSDHRIESKDDYKKDIDWRLYRANHCCFDVWLGRMLYDYKLDWCATKEDVEVCLKELEPPLSNEYKCLYQNAEEKEVFGIFDEDEVNSKYGQERLCFDNYVFALLPITNPWEALAWFPMGGFNWCPSAYCQIALAKELYEKYEARIMYIGVDRLIYYLEKPLMDKVDIESAARTLIIADGDIYCDYEEAAKNILGSHTWTLWWD